MNVHAPSTGAPTRRQLLLGWAATVVPIGAWMVHLTGEAALVRVTCEHRDIEWVMHALTAATALVCLACLAIGVSYARRPAEAPGNGAFRFLGVLAASVAFVNLLVIVWEGAYVPFLPLCR
jgi:hypothetical protein